MGDHKLSKLVLNCIEDDSDKRPNAEEIVNCLQRELAKLHKKEEIVRRSMPHSLPKLSVIALGAANSGKTSVIKRFVYNNYRQKECETEAPTSSQEFHFKNISLGDKNYRLQIIDTAGQERFHGIPQNYVRNVEGILLVFDVRKRDSLFVDIPKVLDLLDAGKADATSIILVGNKVDENVRQVTSLEAEQYARELGVQYIETSAKTGENVKKLFEEMTRAISETLDLSNIGVFVPSAGDFSIHLEDDAPGDRNIWEKMRDGMCR